ncbi:sulfatase-like hydrolase/transferase [Lentisphaera marina]|uniref:sulfatase-like hydrolase/transferase n=1 Tax=Lentisphaera marina TaxID=1111041 RepID=UPI0023659E15|nr:sulfatase-like hydrolase/transferase [Lentisphaera marina]MDD7987301.1 sulfatase-like hydrolase/transferase [Lentisphaera marina]
MNYFSFIKKNHSEISGIYIVLSCISSFIFYLNNLSEVRYFLISQDNWFLTEGLMILPQLLMITGLIVGVFLGQKLIKNLTIIWFIACLVFQALTISDPLKYYAIASWFYLVLPLCITIYKFSKGFIKSNNVEDEHYLEWIWTANSFFISCQLTLCIQSLIVLNELPVSFTDSLSVTSKLSSLVCIPIALSVTALGLILCSSIKRKYGKLIFCAFVGSSASILFSIVTISGIIVIEKLTILHIIFSFVVTIPVVLAFLSALLDVNKASFGQSLRCFLAFISSRLFNKNKTLLSSIIVVLGLFSCHSLVGYLHHYYSWGSVTRILYNTIAIIFTWLLITLIRSDLQKKLITCGWGVSIISLAWFITFAPSNSSWQNYMKFDKNITSLKKVYFKFKPNQDKHLIDLRNLLDETQKIKWQDCPSIEVKMTNDNIDKPSVLYIIIDALRGQSYQEYTQNRNLGGLKFLKKNFVEYDNAWSTYNATAGSMPALLNGIKHPIWYKVSTEQADNVKNTTAVLAENHGYSMHNLADYMGFDKFWPHDSTHSNIPKGNGYGDPEVIFEYAYEQITKLNRKEMPFFVYSHIYNIHQPLLDRGCYSEKETGSHWMKSLYEDNIQHMDKELLKLLSSLKEDGVLDNTVIIVTSDHGEELNDFGGLYHGWQLNPYVMSVPLFVHYPKSLKGIPNNGTKVSYPCNLIDIAPTLADIMGSKIVSELPAGKSLLKLEELDRNRKFPLFNWQTRSAGIISFNPVIMEVIDFNGGELSTFSKNKGWFLTENLRTSEDVSLEINSEIQSIIKPWK